MIYDDGSLPWNPAYVKDDIQIEQLNMAVFLWFLGKSNFSSVHVYSGVH